MLNVKSRVREEVKISKFNNERVGDIYLCAGCSRERWIKRGNESQSSEFYLSCSYRNRIELNKLKNNIEDYNIQSELEKICPSCLISQNISNFEKKVEKYTSKCNRCRRLKKYNITLRDYNNLLESQNFVCAICHKPETMMDNRGEFIKNLAVDHCYTTGIIRGLLCTACNTSIGKFGEDDIILERALNYVRKYKIKK